MQPSLRHACLLIACVLVSLGGLVACQEHSNSPVVNIDILGSRGDNSYRPGNISVNMGTLVTWTNQDSVPHSVTAPGAFDSGMIAPNGGRFTWMAAMQGTFAYFSITDQSMKGSITVVVQPITGPPPSP